MGAEKRRINEKLKDIYPEGVPGQNGHFYVLEPAIDWVMKMALELQQPYLAYIHLLPPHEPYLPRMDFVGRFMDDWKPQRKPKAHFSQGYLQQYLNQYRRSYDEYIANLDSEFGRLFDFLEQNGVLENTYLILTSDHGEMFERGIQGHSTEALYEPVVQIPLMIVRPGQTQREDIYVNTSSMDILPTLVQLAGMTIPDWVEGQILPPFADTNRDNQRPIFFLEAKSNPKLAPLEKASFGIIRGDYKLMHYRGYEHKKEPPDHEMFNLAEDPEEMVDIYKSEKGIASELKDILHSVREEANKLY
jgi:arylsulfatase A-like enzyme